jgi:hypothetical protein
MCGTPEHSARVHRYRLPVADWVSISSFATAGGTLVLAGATFASVRSANRAARSAERSLLANLRPVLVPSKLDDAPQKVGFRDDRWFMLEGSRGMADVTDEAIYLTMSLRNAGQGLAVLHGWVLVPERVEGEVPPPDLADFHRLTRDIYIPPGDIGFWQGALREPTGPEFDPAKKAIESRDTLTVYLLYGDQEGGQRTISRFAMMPRSDGDYVVVVVRHWNIDRADPR